MNANMMADGVISLDDRPALEAIKRANAGLDEHEKKAKTVLDRTGREWQVYGDGLVRVTDKSKNSLDRLLQSMERQAAFAGKSGVERLVAERDQLIARWGKEDAAVQAITKSYAKLIEAESAKGAPAGLKEIGAAAGESRASLALLGEEIGIHIPRHVRGFISSMPGVGQALDAGFKTAAIAAVVMVVYEAIKKVVELREHLRELAEQHQKVTEAFRGMNETVQASADQLRLENDNLANTIAKLEGKPENMLVVALDDARIAADKLGESLDKDVDNLAKLIKANSVGWLGRYMGYEGTGDVEKWVAEYQKAVRSANYAGSENVHHAPSKDAADKAQADWNAALEALRKSAQEKLSGWIAEARSPHIEGAGTIFEQKDQPEKRAARLAMLQGIERNLDIESDMAALQGQHTTLKNREQVLNAQVPDQRKEEAELKRFREEAQAFERRGDEAELDATGKIYYQRDLLLQQAEKLKGVEADVAAIRKSADEQAGTLLEKSRREFERYANEQQAKQKVPRALLGLPSDAELREQEEGFAAAERIDSINLQSRADTLNRNAGRAQKMVGLSGLTGTDAIRETYQIRIDLAKELAGIEAERISKEQNAAKWSVDIAQAQAAVQKQLAEAQEEALMKQMELQKQQMDTLKKDTEGLWHTLLTKPQNFGKQLGSTVHEAVIKPVAEGMSAVTANVLKPIIYGQDGSGGLAGIFRGAFGGGKQDPMKLATDMNTAVTSQNSIALATLTAVLAGAMGMAAPAVAAPAGLAGISPPAISAPAVSGFFGSPINAGGGSNPLAMIMGGGSGGGTGSGEGAWSEIPTLNRSTGGGGNPLAMILGAGRQGGGVAPGGDGGSATGGVGGIGGGIGGMLKNFKSFKLGGLTRSDPTYGTDENGSDVQTSAGKITGVNGMAGAALAAGGMMLAQQGLLGSSRGTWGGIAEGTAGGAAIGFQQGGVLGAGIGGAIGLGIGLGEKLAGVETPENEAKRLVKQLYSVSIDTAMAKQIVDIAKSKYAGHVSIAVRDPDVRKMLELYAQGTGQKMPLSATTPRGGSLAEQRGNLYQQATYVNGVATTFQSSLPVLGSPSMGTYPTPGGPNTAAGMGPINLSLNVGEGDAASFFTGQVVTPTYVADASMAAQNASYGRVQQAANMQLPGLTT